MRSHLWIHVTYTTQTNSDPKHQTAKDIMWEQGGPGVYAAPLSQHHKLVNPAWQGDVMPEIFDGKNIADFVDPDIEAKLAALEEEEEQLMKDYEAQQQLIEDEDSDLDEEEIDIVGKIRARKRVLIRGHRRDKNRNSAKLPRGVERTTDKNLEQGLVAGGYEADVAKRVSKRRGKTREQLGPDFKDFHTKPHAPSEKEGASQGIRKKARYSLPNDDREYARNKQKGSMKKLQQFGKAGTADRYIGTKMPKYLFSGKRSGSKTTQSR